MIELQFINALLDRRDFQIVRLNDIDASYFPTYKEEFKFIEQHYDTYNRVPDKETFIRRFNNFRFIEVNESEDYLIDAIREEKVYNTATPIVLEAGSKLNKGQDSREVAEFMLSKMPELTKQLSFKAVDLVKDAELRLQAYKERSQNRSRYFIPTGFKELDELIGGWDAKEEFAVISARTNQGKSWILDFVLTHALKQGKRVGLYSGEMSEEKVGFRVDTFFSHISNYSLVKGNGEVAQDYEKSIEEFKKLSGAFYICTPKMFGGPATVAKLRAFCEKYKIDILGVDQYSLLDDSNNSRSARFEKYENISKDLKILQSQMQIPIVMAAQLNRGATSKDVDTPGTEHLAGSDRLAQDATLILSLQQKENNTLWIEVMKSRDGKKNNKLIYNWQIDTGVMEYVPTEDEPDIIKSQNKCEEVKKTYDKYDNKEPF